MAKRKFNVLSILILFNFFISSIVSALTHEPLTMDQGFQFTANIKNPQTILLTWQMAPGYFLYRNHLTIRSDNAKLGQPLFPKGVIKSEPGFGDYEVYLNKVSIPVPIKSATNNIKLIVHYQGCSEEGYCYPPTDKTITLTLPPNTLANTSLPTELISKKLSPSAVMPEINANEPISAQDQASQLLNSGHLFTILVSFLGFGLLLSFTPCILPMLPILSGIIVGQNREKLNTARAFTLSLIYVLSMSLTYSIAGILVGYAGGSIQAVFQKPWLLVTFSLMFVALALSFFGLYELRFPQRFQTALSKVSNRQRGGSYLGVAIMGCIATLIVSPCVTPALVGALGYIGKTGNASLGGIALFALGFGMGLPLLLVGTAGSKLLPKAGLWMDRVKIIFGVILLGMAIWMLDRVLPGTVTLLLWSMLLIGIACSLGLFSPAVTAFSRFNKGLAAICFVYGVILMIGASMGNTSLLQPLHPNVTTFPLAIENQNFKQVNDFKEIKNALNDAKSHNKLVMLDFSAKWCTSCKLMEHRTFNNPDVAKALANFITLKADVTENDNTAKNLEQKFQVIAPPTLLFFDATGKELEKFRVVGEMGPKEFLEHIQSVLKAQQS